MTTFKLCMIPIAILSIIVGDLGPLATPAVASGCFVVRRQFVASPVVVTRTVVRTKFVNRFIAVPTPVYLASYVQPAPLVAAVAAPAAAPARAAEPPAYEQPREAPRAAPRQPEYEQTQPRAAPRQPEYEQPREAPRAAPRDNGYGNGNGGTARGGSREDDLAERIITAIEQLDERIARLEQRLPARRAAPRDNGYDDERREAPRRAAPRKAMPYEEPEEDDDPPPVKRALPKKSGVSSLRRHLQQESRAPARVAPRTTARSSGQPNSTTVSVHRIIVQSCSGCHSSEDGARRGKGLVLVRQGQVVPLTPQLRARIVAEVSGNPPAMPPRPSPPMAPADRAFLIRALSG